MIRSFRDKETEKVFNLKRSKKLPDNIQQKALRKLRMLNRSITIQDLKVPPGNRLKKLKGERKDEWSIRINQQWRICFEWHDDDAYNVEIVDYH